MTKRIRIAIVENSPSYLELIKLYLDRHEQVKIVATVHDSASLISFLKKSPTAADICILDMKLPDMNGFDAMDAIRKRTKLMRVLALTCCNHSYTQHAMISKGVRGFLIRERELMHLGNAVRQIHEMGYYFTPQIPLSQFERVNSGFVKVNLLTRKETAILNAQFREKNNLEIARELSIARSTLSKHIQNIYRKTGTNPSTVMAFAVNNDLVGLPAGK